MLYYFSLISASERPIILLATALYSDPLPWTALAEGKDDLEFLLLCFVQSSQAILAPRKPSGRDRKQKEKVE